MTASIQLVKCTSDGSYTLTQEGKRFLEGIDDNFAVVTVSGLYRTGKSSLLNRLGNTDVFVTSNSISSCTKGIYCLDKLIEYRGKKILLVDSEGLDSLDAANEKHDTVIFSLSLLLSSTFCLNTLGAISDSNINSLSLITTIVQRLSSSMSNKDVRSVIAPLVWISRDFTLELRDKHGKELTRHEYIMDALGSNTNETKQSILKSFPEISFVPISRPVSDEKLLKCVSSLDESQLNPDFVRQVDELRDSLFQAPVKEFQGIKLNGKTFAQMTESFIAAINKGGIPKIDNTLTLITRDLNNKAMKKATDMFTKMTKDITVPRDSIQLLKQLSSVQQHCTQLYRDERFTKIDNDPFLVDIADWIDSRINIIMKQNTVTERQMVTDFENDHITPIRVKVDNSVYDSTDELRADVERAHQIFTETFKGNRSCDMIWRTIIHVPLFRYLEKSDTMSSKNVKDELEKLRRQYAEVVDEKTTVDAKLVGISDKCTDLEQENTKLAGEIQDMTKRVENVDSQIEECVGLKLQLKEMDRKYNETVQILEEKEEHLRESRESTKTQIESLNEILNTKLNRIQKRAEQDAQTREGVIKKLKNENSTLRDNLDKQISESTTMKRTLGELETTIESSKSVIGKLDTQVTVKRQRVSELETEVDQLKVFKLNHDYIVKQNEQLHGDMKELRMENRTLKQQLGDIDTKHQLEIAKIKMNM